MGVDAAAFRAVLGQWPTGVSIVTTGADGQWHGMTASSFSSVSLEPPLVSVCLARSLTTHGLLGDAGFFGVTILAKDQAELGQRFARHDPAQPDRFAGTGWITAQTGAPVHPEALGWLDCRVAHTYAGGDHTIFVGEVLAADTPRKSSPLLYHSRTWGQLADPLPDQVVLTELPAGAEVTVDVSDLAPALEVLRQVSDVYDRPRIVLAGVFDVSPAAGARAVEVVVAETPSEVVLADRTGTATPLTVRETCREVLARAGATPVAVRLSPEGGLAQGNLLTALKSGVHRIDVGPGTVSRADAEHLAAALQLSVLDAANQGVL